jgi:beta-phosphoglucomutase-like phosphatase (HAD superfamily)
VRAVIFDLDGVLVDSMPSHSLSWVQAFKNVARIDVDRRVLYVLEGMRGAELVEKIFAEHGTDRSLAARVIAEKDRIFKDMQRPKPFEGVREMIRELGCAKAVVSGSSRHDVESFLDEVTGKKNFDVVVTADDIRRGKPDPLAFVTALERLRLEPSQAVVVENSPLGARAANKAGILCYVVMNSTLLSKADFAGIVPEERILEKTSSLKGLLKNLCNR